jgi:hypothetical protein
MKKSDNNSKAIELPQRQVQWSLIHLLFPVLICSVVGGGIAVTRIYWGEKTPTLTVEAYEVAKQQWKQAPLQSYRVTVEVHADKTTTYAVEVRDGVARSVLMNQTPLSESRLFDIWSVPGMLSTIAEDIEHVRAMSKSENTGNTPRLRLWCQFDPQNGLPLKYRRLDWDKGIDVSWRVKDFQPLTTETE